MTYRILEEGHVIGNHSYGHSFKKPIRNPSFQDEVSIKNEIDFSNGKNFAINTSSKDYCSEVELPDGKWWCVDGTLTSEGYDSDPACSPGHFTRE